MTGTATQSSLNTFQTSRLGLGCASAWGQPWFDEKKAAAIIERALELGINVFDTGASYSGGNAEPRLGRILKGKETGRLLVSTKIGTRIGNNGALFKDWAPAHLLESIDLSRTRLGLETIPLVYLHGPAVDTLKQPELFQALRLAKERGWVRWFGVNSHDDDVLEALVDIDFFDAVMPDYNLLRVDREIVIERLASSGKMVFGGAAMANHVHAPRFLWPKNRVDVWYLLRAVKNHRQSYMRARSLNFLRSVADWTPSQIAIGFALLNKNIKTAMFGTTRVSHLEENYAGSDRVFPPGLEEKIRAVVAPQR